MMAVVMEGEVGQIVRLSDCESVYKKEAYIPLYAVG